MSIGNFFSGLMTGARGLFNGANNIATNLPGVGSLVKKGEDSLGSSIGNFWSGVGNSVTNQDNTPSTYNENEDNNQKESDQSSALGNIPGMSSNEKEGKEGEEVAENAAGEAAGEEAAAEEVAMMLV
jgi:hypothetical protein